MFKRRNLVLNNSNIKILFIVILVGIIETLHYTTRYRVQLMVSGRLKALLESRLVKNGSKK
jgi:hypothetical protein